MFEIRRGRRKHDFKNVGETCKKEWKNIGVSEKHCENGRYKYIFNFLDTHRKKKRLCFFHMHMSYLF